MRPPICSALRGVEAVSLDVIAAEVGVAKQTLLYWFPSQGRPGAGRAGAGGAAADGRDRGRDPGHHRRPARPHRSGRARRVPPGRAPAGAARSGPRGQPPVARGRRTLPRRAASRWSTGPSCTCRRRWTAAACARPTRAWSPRSATPRSPASPPSPRCCAASAGTDHAELRRLRAELLAFLRAALAP